MKSLTFVKRMQRKVIEALAFDSYTERKLAIEAIVTETPQAMEEQFGADSSTQMTLLEPSMSFKKNSTDKIS